MRLLGLAYDSISLDFQLFRSSGVQGVLLCHSSARAVPPIVFARNRCRGRRFGQKTTHTVPLSRQKAVHDFVRNPDISGGLKFLSLMNIKTRREGRVPFPKHSTIRRSEREEKFPHKVLTRAGEHQTTKTTVQMSQTSRKGAFLVHFFPPHWVLRTVRTLEFPAVNTRSHTRTRLIMTITISAHWADLANP